MISICFVTTGDVFVFLGSLLLFAALKNVYVILLSVFLTVLDIVFFMACYGGFFIADFLENSETLRFRHSDPMLLAVGRMKRVGTPSLPIVSKKMRQRRGLICIV